MLFIELVKKFFGNRNVVEGSADAVDFLIRFVTFACNKHNIAWLREQQSCFDRLLAVENS
jgi:hypothetical protein